MRVRRLKIIFNISLLVVLTMVVVGFAFFKLKDGTLYSVQTDSMAPSINRGDLVAVMRVPDSQLVVGNVVTYINPANADQTITHRLIEVPSDQNQHRFITRGDANPAPDAPVAPSAIIGRSSFTIPFVGYIFDVVRHPIGLIALIYIPALAVIAAEVRRLSDYYRRNQPYYASEAIRKRKMLRIEATKTATALKIVALVIFSLGILSVPALAAISSPATLAGNTITTKSTTPVPPTSPPSSCSNNINVSNNNTQNSQSGNVSVSGNTSGGSASSGNVSNSSSTNINITTNCP